MQLQLELQLAKQCRLFLSPISGLSHLELELLLDQSVQQIQEFYLQNKDRKENNPPESRGNYFYTLPFAEICKSVRGKVPAEEHLKIPQILVGKNIEGYVIKYNPLVEERIAEKLAQFRRTDENAAISADKIFSKQFAKEWEWSIQQQLAITKYLCEIQDAYLQTGKRTDLQPITQGLIAEKIGCSDSSVSRLMKNLSIQLPDGRVIFAQELITGRGAGLYKGIEYLKQLQREPALYENGGWKVSDYQLASILKERFGLAIARRTVCKYKSKMQGLSLEDKTGAVSYTSENDNFDSSLF